MRYGKIGKTDMNASVVSLGTWAMASDSNWGPSDDEESARTIRRALDLGINYADTAPAYGFGHSEEVLGAAVKGMRDKVYLATKCGLRWDIDDDRYFISLQRDGLTLRRVLTPESLRWELERSLKNLGTDYLDMYITHWQNPEGYEPSIEITMKALLAFKKEGKIRGIGISNVTAEQIKEYSKYGTVDLVQNKYSMLDRDAQKEILALCGELGITFQPYSPLERGILAGKIGPDAEVTGRARMGNKWYERENRIKILNMLEKMKPLCEKYSCGLSGLVVAWTLAQSASMNVLCGSRKLEQIEENVEGGGFELEAADLSTIDGYLGEVLA
jgi:methylglyoxal reductase